MTGQQTKTARAPRGPFKRFVITVAASVGVLSIGVLVFKAVVGWVFPVASGSMQPTIATGDWVYVRYGNDEPERYEIVVIDNLAGGAMIKRAFGLMSEFLTIDPTGDVRINGKMVDDCEARPKPIPIFDSTLQSIGELWHHGGTTSDPWTRTTAEGRGEVWRVDGRAVKGGQALGLLRFHEPIDDGVLLADGTREFGRYTVHDAVVEFDARVIAPGGRVRVELTEQGDTFVAFIDFDHEASRRKIATVRYTSDPALREPGPEIIGVGNVEAPIGEWLTIRFSNIDNRLTFSVNDQVLTADYDALGNTLHPSALRGEAISLGERARLGAEALDMEVRNIRIFRDFHIVPHGDFGVDGVITLRSDQIFVLGDSSADSRDSRVTGPIQMERVIGTAKAIVWPRHHAKGL